MDIEEQKKSNKSNHAQLNRLKSGRIMGTLLFSSGKKYAEVANNSQQVSTQNLYFIIVYTEDNQTVYQISKSNSTNEQVVENAKMDLEGNSKQIPLNDLQQIVTSDDIILNMVYETKLYACLVKIDEMQVKTCDEKVFLLLFKTDRISTLIYNVEKMCFELMALHYVNTREVQILNLNNVERQKQHLMKVDINSKAFGVLHNGATISFHVIADYSKNLGIDRHTLMNNQNCLILEDQKQGPNSEISFANSIYQDLRLLGIPLIKDFAFSCHANYIQLFVVGRIPANDGKVITGYSEKIFEIKITPALFHKLRSYQLSDDKNQKDIKVNLKDELKTCKFLAAAKIYHLSLMKNHGLIAITGDGIFYMHQTWYNFLCFEKSVAEKYNKEFKMFQIQCTELSCFKEKNLPSNSDLSKGLAQTNAEKRNFYQFVDNKNFKAKLYEDNVLMLEGEHAVIQVKIIMSELFESKVNRFEVLEVIDKNACQNFNLLDYKSGLFSVVSENKACFSF